MEVFQNGNVRALAPCGRSLLYVDQNNCPWCEYQLANGDICGYAKEDHVEGSTDPAVTPWCWSPPRRRVNQKFLMDVRNVHNFDDHPIQWAFIKVYVEVISPIDAPIAWPVRWTYFKALVKEVSRLDQYRDLGVQWKKTRQHQNWTAHCSRKIDTKNKVNMSGENCVNMMSIVHDGAGMKTGGEAVNVDEKGGELYDMGVSLVGMVPDGSVTVAELREGVGRVDIVGEAECESGVVLNQMGGHVVSNMDEEEGVGHLGAKVGTGLGSLIIGHDVLDPRKPTAGPKMDQSTQTECTESVSMGTQWELDDVCQQKVVYADEYNRSLEEGHLLWLDVPEIGDPQFGMLDLLPSVIDDETDRQLTSGTKFFSKWLGKVEIEVLHPRFIYHQTRMIRNNFKGKLPAGTVRRLLDNLITVPGDGNCFWACLTEAFRRQHPQWRYPFGQRGQKGVFAPLKNLVSKNMLMMRHQIVCSVKWGEDGNTPVGYSLQVFDHLLMTALKDLCSRYDGNKSELNTPFFSTHGYLSTN